MNKKTFFSSAFSASYLSVALVAGALLGLTGCEDKASGSNATTNATSQVASNTLTILAGSELKDMEPILQKASAETGVVLKIEYTGTIDGVDRIKQGQAYDAAWFSQSKYFYDTEENAKKIKGSEKFMFSPIAVGMRQASYSKSNLSTLKQVSWSNLYDLVSQKNYKYAMTDPSASNTGYSALLGVAYSTAKKTEALKESDIDAQKMKNFFKGHSVNSGSSGWLTQAFKDSQADFMVNYESVLLQYNEDNPADKLQVIYPFEGIVTADYPLLLLNLDKSESYKKLVAYLKRPDTQKEIVAQSKRRVLDTEIMAAASIFPKTLLIEMPFNPDAALSDALLSSYFQEYKKPAAIVFVLDVSGSMSQLEKMNVSTPNNANNSNNAVASVRRIDMLKNAMAALTVNESPTAKYAHLRNREKVWLMPFGSNIKDLVAVNLTEDATQNKMLKAQINSYVQALRPEDGTYLFSSVQTAVEVLEKEKRTNPNYQYSVVVLTDGESNEGISASTFVKNMETKNIKGQIRVFPILFGEGNQKDLNAVASATGGKMFDGKNKSLSEVFKEIRTYQ